MKKGFAPIIVVLIITIPFVLLYLAAWAPWVSPDFARQKALASNDKSCRELNTNEYADNNPYEMKSLTLGEQLGLTPPFGHDITLYVICNDKSTKNSYFVSFLGSVKLKESTPIPHRVSVEQPQNTIEKIDEAANWKIYTSRKGKFEIKYPNEMTIYTEKTHENNVANLILHSSTTFTFSITVYPEVGTVVATGDCDRRSPLVIVSGKAYIDGVEGCYSDTVNMDTGGFELRVYSLIHNGWLYNPSFSWKTGEKNSELMDQMISTFKFL